MTRYSAGTAVWWSGALLAWSGIVILYGRSLVDFAGGMLDADLTRTVTDKDFANYWLAGRLALAGEPQALFHIDAYVSYQQAIFGPEYHLHAWSYPPHFLLFLWPLGLLRYKPALAVFLVATFVLFVYAVVVFRRAYAPHANRTVLLLPLVAYALMMVHATQNGFLTAAAALLGFAWMKQRPALAAVAFAFLTIKPQLGLMIPVLLIIERNWRAIGWTALFTAGLVSLSLAVFGPQSWHDYLTQTLAYQRQVMTDWEGLFLKMMPTMFGSLRTLSVPWEVAAHTQWAMSLAAAVLAIWLLHKERDPLRRVCTVTCATFLVTPYAFNYDMGALMVAAAVLAGSTARPGRAATVAISVVAGLPAAVMILGAVRLPIAPLILAGALAALAANAIREGDRARLAAASTAGSCTLRN